MPGTIEAKLAELGITLPQAAVPIANYVPFVVTGRLVVISGQIPMRDGKVAYAGKISQGMSINDGQDAARLCFINLLAQLKVDRSNGFVLQDSGFEPGVASVAAPIRDVAGEIVAAINVSAVTILTREGELHGVLKTEILKAAEALSRDLGADRNQATEDQA